jgi:ribonucleoside-triphosphate reductase
MNFFELNLIDMSESKLDDWIAKHKSKYLNKLNLLEKDFCFDNKENLDNKFYQCALFETRKEIYQAVEGLYHNLNTLQSRSGNQLPFTSINYGTCTLPEGRMIIKALLEVSIEGLGKNKKTSIFPC